MAPINQEQIPLCGHPISRFFPVYFAMRTLCTLVQFSGRIRRIPPAHKGLIAFCDNDPTVPIYCPESEYTRYDVAALNPADAVFCISLGSGMIPVGIAGW